MPRSRAQAEELAAISKAVAEDACAQFVCAEYEARVHANASAAHHDVVRATASSRDVLATPGPPAVATTPMVTVGGGPAGLRRVKERKRKKADQVGRQATTTATPAGQQPAEPAA